jgi:hypothetical protein
MEVQLIACKLFASGTKSQELLVDVVLGESLMYCTWDAPFLNVSMIARGDCKDSFFRLAPISTAPTKFPLSIDGREGRQCTAN